MLPATKLAVRAEIFNNGKKPFVVKPFARLEVLNDDVEQKIHLVKLRVPSETEPFLFQDERNSGSSQDVVVDSFLPESEGSSYVLVPPGGSVSISATSVVDLGNAGARLRSIFDASVLRCRLTLIDSSGTMIMSDELLFGVSADRDLKRELLSMSNDSGRNSKDLN